MKAWIDEELRSGIDLYPSLDLENNDLTKLRAELDQFIPDEDQYSREDISIEHLNVEGSQGNPAVPVIVYRPINAKGPLPVVLHIHGGGYIFGTAEEVGPGNVRTASELECLVVSVNYRLAPEFRAPSAVEDCYAVLRWLHENSKTLGISSEKIAVMGESAGGGLAACLSILARDKGEFPICFQCLVYPMLDDRTASPKMDRVNPFTGEFIWTRQSNKYAWEAYLGVAAGHDYVPAYSVAARTEDLSNLPPAYICVGALDLFLEECVDYGLRLLRAGVPTDMRVYAGAYHGYELAANARVTLESETERREAIRRAFAR